MSRYRLIEADKKGELRIPSIRPLDQFYLFTGKDYILLKKMETPTPLANFQKLSLEIQEQFKTKGLKKTEINKAIKWARKK